MAGIFKIIIIYFPSFNWLWVQYLVYKDTLFLIPCSENKPFVSSPKCLSLCYWYCHVCEHKNRKLLFLNYQFFKKGVSIYYIIKDTPGSFLYVQLHNSRQRLFFSDRNHDTEYTILLCSFRASPIIFIPFPLIEDRSKRHMFLFACYFWLMYEVHLHFTRLFTLSIARRFF